MAEAAKIDPVGTTSSAEPTGKPSKSKADGTTETKRASTPSDSKAKFSIPGNAYWLLLLPVSIVWWYTAGYGNRWQSILLAGVSIAAFMVGALVGFLFTSYGEELTTLGKIRDWIIAGVTGATLTELAEQGGTIKRLLMTFKTPGGDDFGLVISMATVYFACGFFFMFLQRTLLLNLLFAKSRFERGKLDGTVQAELAIQKLLTALPPSLLTGTTNLDDELEEKKAKPLRALLESEEVTLFLSQAEEAVKAGIQIDWDNVSKAAYIYYYRVYFSSASEQPALVDKAIEWIRHALLLNQMHVDLTMKYADMLVFDEQYDVAVAILEQMKLREQAPAYVYNWLGYALLWIPERLQESIENSKKFLDKFNHSADALFNIACAHAQLYCQALKAGKEAEHEAQENRRQALKYLEDALRRDSEYMKNIRAKEEDFECLESDEDYKKLKEAPPAKRG